MLFIPTSQSESDKLVFNEIRAHEFTVQMIDIEFIGGEKIRNL